LCGRNTRHVETKIYTSISKRFVSAPHGGGLHKFFAERAERPDRAAVALTSRAMRRLLIALAAVAVLVPVVGAQEGHPLTGTWSGDWGTGPAGRTHVTIVMEWDGKVVAGILNPGPDQSPLSSVVLDPTTWTVRIEADSKNAQGQTVHVSAEGKLDDIASYHRKLTGSWTQGGTKGDFNLTRN
jgi:hypothetical protein